MRNGENILGKKILVVVAHPDDEAFLAGGTIYANTKASGTTTLYSATLGEQGKAYVNPDITENDIKVLRKAELEKAATFLGISKIILDELSDRNLEKDLYILSQKIYKVIKDEKPEVILGFGPDGYTGHKDHSIIGETTEKIAKELNLPYFAFSHPPESICKNFVEYLTQKRVNGSYFDNFEKVEPDVQIKVDPLIKMEVLKIYQSQFPGLDPYKIFPSDIAEHLLTQEYFRKKN